MRIFFAGATGVVGRPLVPRLVADGHEVTAMTRTPAKADAALGAPPGIYNVTDDDPAPRYSSWRQGFREALG